MRVASAATVDDRPFRRSVTPPPPSIIIIIIIGVRVGILIMNGAFDWRDVHLPAHILAMCFSHSDGVRVVITSSGLEVAKHKVRE